MKYYPVLLDLKAKKCVVIGAGSVAERKVNSLLEAGANVWLISPKLNQGLSKLKRSKKIHYIKSAYKRNFLKGAVLVIGATDDRAINSKVSGDASKLGILVNIVDSPQNSNFIVPAVARKGDLIISVSTSGKAPCLSKKIKEDLIKGALPKYSRHLELLSDLREKLKSKYISPELKRLILTSLINSRVL